MSNETTTRAPADVRERVLTVLTAIEWAAQVDHPDGGWYACCPWCEGGDPEDEETPPGRAGHAELCELAAVLALLHTPRGEGEASGLAECIITCMGCGQNFDANDDAQARYHEAACEIVDHEPARVEIARRLRGAALRSEAQGEVWREVDDLLARLERFEYDAAGESEEYWRVVAMRDRIAAARRGEGGGE